MAAIKWRCAVLKYFGHKERHFKANKKKKIVNKNKRKIYLNELFKKQGETVKLEYLWLERRQQR